MSFYKVLFLAGMFVLPSVAASSEAPRVRSGNWEYVISTDVMTDKSRGIAILAQGDERLIVKCDASAPERSMYIHLLPGKYVGEGRNNGIRDVTVRFDQDEPYTETWIHDSSDAILIEPRKVTNFVNRLIAAKKVAVRLTAYDYTSMTVVFELDGAATAVAKAYEACGAAFPPTWG